MLENLTLAGKVNVLPRRDAHERAHALLTRLRLRDRVAEDRRAMLLVMTLDE